MSPKQRPQPGRTTVSRTPLDEWSARNRDLNLDAPQSVGLLWTSVQPETETSTWTHHRQWDSSGRVISSKQRPQPGRTTGSRTHLDEWSARNSDLNLDPSHSVGFLWTSDQSVAETSTWQHTALTTDRHPCPGWDSNPQSQQASGGVTYALELAATRTGLNIFSNTVE